MKINLLIKIALSNILIIGLIGCGEVKQEDVQDNTSHVHQEDHYMHLNKELSMATTYREELQNQVQAQLDYDTQVYDAGEAQAKDMLLNEEREEYYAKRDKEIQQAKDNNYDPTKDEPLKDIGKAAEWYNNVIDFFDENTPEIGNPDDDYSMRVNEVKDGRIYDDRNKHSGVYEGKTMEEMKDILKETKDDPNAMYGFYSLRYYDGKDVYGDNKYIYINGLAKSDVWNRYKSQLGNNVEILGFKRFANAKDYEGHFNKLAFDANLGAVKYGDDKKSGTNFGSGYTELIKEDVFGLDKGVTNKDLNDRLDAQKSINSTYMGYKY